MKKLILLLGIIFTILILLGCSVIQHNTIAGTYYAAPPSNAFITLSSDGTFVAGAVSGTYEVHGKELDLLILVGVATCEIDGKTITTTNSLATDYLSGHSFTKK